MQAYLTTSESANAGSNFKKASRDVTPAVPSFFLSSWIIQASTNALGSFVVQPRKIHRHAGISKAELVVVQTDDLPRTWLQNNWNLIRHFLHTDKVFLFKITTRKINRDK